MGPFLTWLVTDRASMERMKRDLPEQFLWGETDLPESLLASRAVWIAVLLSLAFWALLLTALH
jgi:hypothetical protein